jgi:hypothetical protein|tara:strand:- start:423 stop:1220 length:798 start_codon:yes stop_codon:yes gene_type:complete
MPEENTFTISDAQPETEVLTPEEQDSLKVGEQLEAEHEGLLAGKYKDTKDLESAYLELQKKLGDKDAVSQEGQGDETQEVEEPKAEDNPAMALITDASAEYYANDNTLSDETIEKFSSMSSKDLVNAYVQSLKNAPQQQQAQEVEMTDSQINQVQNSVGGEKQYNEIVSWAGKNLGKSQIEAFDGVVQTGNVEMIKLAVAGLKSQYSDANGFEGTTLQGKPAKASGDVFRSQAELVAAIGDPRYDTDPAYRDDVISKLDRSNIDF